MRITKAMKKMFENKAKELVQSYNPYIKCSVEYAIGGAPMFIFLDKSMTKEEIDNAYIETALKDIQAGYEQRMVGYYDKWYRYNHSDEGRAYDAGQRMAADTDKCPAEFQIIECTA